ncbi:VOC family protein [Dactylosporangium matsuzakiense]|uniref:Glyoxalase n=1 Tax=Dactylosporangium matsuzakiense TaxID=53360 RepID=A0A9W6NRZ7_9ACTN|nr:VOC family protein [Dactylosporangium matsuzakiense]UWZ41784.1 VOC family protein [Dactylosporangium matsuzakiense]GLL06958.1 glyoxalase [Dactylosporangium matsuzakiense]
MVTNISLVTVYCLNQDEAREFYVDRLGFEPGQDVTMGEFRWVTVRHPNQPELDVVLMKPGPPLDDEAAGFIRRQLGKGGLGGLGLRVDDCRKTHAELAAKGVEFVQEPEDRPYGVEAVLRDNSGNWLVIVQPFAPPAY